MFVIPSLRKERFAMIRKCSHCGKEFTPQELSREDSKGLEAERKAMGLEGVLFRYYRCSACGQADIFVDICPLTNEFEEDFRQRQRELEATLQQLEGEGVEVVVSARE
jgi:DNA-directed RNA polymerase subunit RPC12/RpoP